MSKCYRIGYGSHLSSLTFNLQKLLIRGKQGPKCRRPSVLLNGHTKLLTVMLITLKSPNNNCFDDGSTNNKKTKEEK